MRRKTLIVLLLGVQPAMAVGAILTMRGLGADVWTENSAVYAEVTSVKDLGRGHLRVTLQVHATLTGSFDAAATPLLETDLYYGAKISAIRQPPVPKGRVVVIVRRLSHAPDIPYFIPSDFVTFMPNQTAIAPVQGFDDPKMAQIITRLRELRSRKHGKAPDAGAQKRLQPEGTKDTM